MTSPSPSSPPEPAPAAPATWRTTAAAAITVVLWASAFVGIRAAAPHFGAGPLALLRLLTGSVVLGVLVISRREKLPVGRDWWPVVVIGVLWFGVYNVTLNAGERAVDAGTAAMLVNIGPILIALLAGWLLHEGYPRFLVIGLAIAFAGAVVVGIATSSGGATSVTGVLMCLLAAISYAAAVVTQKPLLARISALQVTFLGCLIGAIVCLPFSGQLISQIRVAPASAIWTVVYLGVFPTAIAFTTWAYALRHSSAGRLGATTYVVPALVICMSLIVLGQGPPAGAIAGGVLCLAGVAVSRISPARKKAAPTAAPASLPQDAGLPQDAELSHEAELPQDAERPQKVSPPES